MVIISNHQLKKNIFALIQFFQRVHKTNYVKLSEISKKQNNWSYLIHWLHSLNVGASTFSLYLWKFK